MILVYGYYPFPIAVRGGWMRRIAAIDALLAGRPRCYVFPIEPGAPLDYRLREQDTLGEDRLPADVRFYRPDLRFAAHCRKLTALVDEAEFVYAHTSHSAQHLLPYYRTGKIVTDVHGIAPEEERMQGAPGRARFYESFEETMVRQSAALVTVTQAMADHFRAKYPGLPTPFLHLPILDDIPEPELHRPRRRLRVVYAGGLQRWQNPAVMVATAAKLAERYEFTFCTHQINELEEMLAQHGARGRVRVTCLEPAELSALYAEQDLGFVLRDDDPVNRVSCPTKLTEYLAHGVVPIVSCVAIGDFAALGYRYIELADFLADRIPDHATLNDMRRHNRMVYERLRQSHAAGMQAVRDLRVAAAQPTLASHPGLFLTSLERSTLPLDGARVEARWSDGAQATLPIDEAFHTASRSVLLPLHADSGRSLCHVRVYPGSGPFVTSPVGVRALDADGKEHSLPVTGNHGVDAFGNWVFAERDAWVEASGFSVPAARQIRLDYEMLLEGPETFMALDPAVPLHGLAELPGLRAELATARAEAASLRASFSWRVTEPGRSLGRMLASLRRRG